MTLTRPDGTESIELLALTGPEKAAIDPHFARLIDTLAEGGLSRSAACRMLMARLVAEQETTIPGTASRGTKGEDKRHA
jgi:S-adenosylmethionine:tRNA-ribosyltransferase-isomerase (queuine synthetase)